MIDWRPSASMITLRNRAAFFSSIRQFFEARGVLEVDTPFLSPSTITDVHMEAMHTTAAGKPMYLQTSPEYYMKRLLAAGSGDIYQLGKCFRDEKASRIHSPEFTMLEWYRVGFSMQQLMDELSELTDHLIGLSCEQHTYQALFEKHLSVNPIIVNWQEVAKLAMDKGLKDYVLTCEKDYDLSANASEESQKGFVDAILQVLFSVFIEPKIGADHPVIVSHFPASQATLAALSADNNTALRFELYYKGVELANGYEEATDADLLLRRFNADNNLRMHLGKQTKAIDKAFVAAMKSGLPSCSGVALGIDRLLMLAENAQTIASVMPFRVE
ncbi:elongation factor P--(R)-beta-lysine ligase [Agaribacter flavus]|uniref:Elongation factor P--(R)-beta-lysine ligase n=1 Tax=Agaribacter flavus TaxID=1902781 RepID=A0ABV7FLI1_9ALTE